MLCTGKLNYADYIEKCISDKECTFMLLTEHNFKLVTEHHFQLTFGGEAVTISFEARQFPKLPFELIFAEGLLKKIQVSSLAYGIVSINSRVTYITNEVITSRHDCV